MGAFERVERTGCEPSYRRTEILREYPSVELPGSSSESSERGRALVTGNATVRGRPVSHYSFSPSALKAARSSFVLQQGTSRCAFRCGSSDQIPSHGTARAVAR